jgi:multiple antibiotic resistance protein
MKEHLQAIVTILALVNPVMCMALFSNCVAHVPKKEKAKSALKALAAIGIVLLVAAVGGTPILGVFGISLDAFSCAGGGILVWIGVGMLQAARKDTNSGPAQASQSSNSLAPLILFAASPGTIMGVITIAAAHEKPFLPVTAIVGVLVTLVILAAALLLATRIVGGQRKVGLAKEMTTSYMGVIVIAMGVQFAMNGFKGFFS